MKHFVFSDIHGNWELFTQIKEFLNGFDEWTCIVIGDACDRGPAGYAIMKELLADERFVYMMGNHERMFLDAVSDLHNMCRSEKTTLIEQGRLWIEHIDRTHRADLYFANGGRSTFEAWLDDGAPTDFIAKIKKLPYIVQYNQYDILHAGCSVFLMEDIDDWSAFEEEEVVWDRTHFIQGWTKGRVLIHGHTPVWHLPHSILRMERHTTWTPVVYNDREKIDMDTATFYSGRISLMDLDTGEFHHFATTSALPLDFA